MNKALFTALYVERTLFQWVHFTKFGTIPGAVSRDKTKAELGLT